MEVYHGMRNELSESLGVSCTRAEQHVWCKCLLCTNILFTKAWKISPSSDSWKNPHAAGTGSHRALQPHQRLLKNTGGYKQSRRCLLCIGGNLLTQVTEKGMRKGALLDLRRANKEEVVSDVNADAAFVAVTIGW